MSKDLKKVGKPEKSCDVAEKVVVAVKASKEIPKTALVWALTHVVQPGDCITLVVVVSLHHSGRKLWGFPRFAGDCATGHRRSHTGTSAELKSDLTDYCSQMILQLHDVYDPNKINAKIKIVSGTPCGAVAAEARKNQATWTPQTRGKALHRRAAMQYCTDEAVPSEGSSSELVGSPKKQPEVNSHKDQSSKKQENKSDSLSKNDSSSSARGPVVTPSSSPETFSATEAGTSSGSSSDPGTSPFFVPETKDGLKKVEILITETKRGGHDESSSDTESENWSASSSLRFQPWMADIVNARCQSFEHIGESSRRSNNSINALVEKLSKLDVEAGFKLPSYRSNLDIGGRLREVISLRTAPSGPPPLCSICQHKAPVFGKPPRWFTYAELELATGRFSQANFLAEGGFGSVHRGILPDGQAIAVKQHKFASSQGDQEFCSEVEVLSCAQQRNVVMLIGFCIEDSRRLLVYEYICNGSLDSHLYGRQQDTLAWNSRKKIAVGAARGLRYLHEECRVGCIVHRDMRPNNILITHDFEPLVGDFGLARSQPDGETGVETRVIGTLGYLSPEYAQSGQITEKADVYSFGVVLLELVTGLKSLDINRPKDQQFLTEWARPLLEACAIDELLDPRLGGKYAENEVYCMLHAASLCIRQDPQARPRMSQVLRILEGDVMNSSQISSPRFEVGNRSGRFCSSDRQHGHCVGPIKDEESVSFSSRLSVNSRTSFRDVERASVCGKQIVGSALRVCGNK